MLEVKILDNSNKIFNTKCVNINMACLTTKEIKRKIYHKELTIYTFFHNSA